MEGGWDREWTGAWSRGPDGGGATICGSMRLVGLDVDEEGRRLVVPRGKGCGVHMGWEMDVLLWVAAASW